MFEMASTRPGDPRGGARLTSIECGACGARHSAKLETYNEEIISKFFTQKGWRVGSTKSKHRCPTCMNVKKKSPAWKARVVDRRATRRQRATRKPDTEAPMQPLGDFADLPPLYAKTEWSLVGAKLSIRGHQATTTVPFTVTSLEGSDMPTSPTPADETTALPISAWPSGLPISPRQPTREDRRRILDALDAHYIVQDQRYSKNFSDDTISAQLNLPRAWITEERDRAFGPDRNEAALEHANAVAALAEQFEALKNDAMKIAERAEELEREAKRLKVSLSCAMSAA